MKSETHKRLNQNALKKVILKQKISGFLTFESTTTGNKKLISDLKFMFIILKL